MDERVPATWSGIIEIRERLVRIETLLEQSIANQDHLALRANSLEGRQTALETGRMANRADIESNTTRILALETERKQVDMSAKQFNDWKAEVDKAILAVNTGVIVVHAKSSLLAQEWKILTGIGGVAAIIGGLIGRFS